MTPDEIRQASKLCKLLPITTAHTDSPTVACAYILPAALAHIEADAATLQAKDAEIARLRKIMLDAACEFEFHRLSQEGRYLRERLAQTGETGKIQEDGRTATPATIRGNKFPIKLPNAKSGETGGGK